MEISISSGWLWFIIIAIIITVIYILSSFAALRKAKDATDKARLESEQQGERARNGIELKLAQQQLEFSKVENDLKINVTTLAQELFEKFKEVELDAYRKVIKEATLQVCRAELQGWIIAEGKGIRQDAVTRSMGVNFGKITEHLVPFSYHLENFDPRDIRFIGSPVDLMIFDGATAKKDIINIYLVEIKTGGGQLSKKQKSIREAIDSHRVKWLPIIVPEFKWDIADEAEGANDTP